MLNGVSGTHNKAFSVVAVRVSNPDRSPFESIAETQPQLQPALLRLSAMISQYFTAAPYFHEATRNIWPTAPRRLIRVRLQLDLANIFGYGADIVEGDRDGLELVAGILVDRQLELVGRGRNQDAMIEFTIGIHGDRCRTGGTAAAATGPLQQVSVTPEMG